MAPRADATTYKREFEFDHRKPYIDSSASFSDSSEPSKLRVKSAPDAPMQSAYLRYNHLNPFFFYSINNFPIQSYSETHQSMPFFNYIVTDGFKGMENLKVNRIDSGMLSTKSDSGNARTEHSNSNSNNDNEQILHRAESVMRS